MDIFSKKKTTKFVKKLQIKKKSCDNGSPAFSFARGVG